MTGWSSHRLKSNSEISLIPAVLGGKHDRTSIDEYCGNLWSKPYHSRKRWSKRQTPGRWLISADGSRACQILVTQRGPKFAWLRHSSFPNSFIPTIQGSLTWHGESFSRESEKRGHLRKRWMDCDLSTFVKLSGTLCLRYLGAVRAVGLIRRIANGGLVVVVTIALTSRKIPRNRRYFDCKITSTMA